jgi:peptidoglycan/LPS O-acetylase OafA/YrhL
VLAFAAATLPVLLWAFLGGLLVKLRRRGRVPAGAVWVVIVTGVAANAYPVLRLSGANPPRWMWAPCLAVALLVGYGYMLAQLRKHRAVIHGPWPEDPATVSRREERRLVAEHYRAVVARLNERDRAGVDAPGGNETEAR